MMPTMITMAGSRGGLQPLMARPWITLVPWPDTEAWATDFTGRKPVPV